jgi:hypothetical protein
MPKTAATIRLTGQDEQTLRRWTRSISIRAGLAQRARVVLAAAEGLRIKELKERFGPPATAPAGELDPVVLTFEVNRVYEGAVGKRQKIVIPRRGPGGR